jgi:hypothetical protein
MSAIGNAGFVYADLAAEVLADHFCFHAKTESVGAQRRALRAVEGFVQLPHGGFELLG